MKTYQWQGEPVEVQFGYVTQEENSEKPMYWYNFECYNREKLEGGFKPGRDVFANGKHFACIPALKVTSKNGYSFLLANHYGIGVNKLLKGGWPNMPHYSLDGEFSESILPYFRITKFDEDGYCNHESARKDWQKKEYPEEFERLERFRAGFKIAHKF
jgi:hypothetical protein